MALSKKERAAKHKARMANSVLAHSTEKAAKAARRMNHFDVKANAAKKWKLKALTKEAKTKRNLIKHRVRKAKKDTKKADHQKKKALHWHAKLKKYKALQRKMTQKKQTTRRK